MNTEEVQSGASAGTYHHGDLPATLMDMALEKIAEEGTEKLSLRALAREAGVSPTAPYRHFPTKRCLLAALATRGFRRLQAINDSHDLDGADLEESFVALGMGYIRFAQENPTTYQIMFGTVIDDFSEYPDLTNAADESYAPVRTLIELILAQHPDSDLSVDLLGGVTWSIVHGMASLLIFGKDKMRTGTDLHRGPVQAVMALMVEPEKALRTLVHGMLSEGPGALYGASHPAN
ncbi:MAG: TetR/AcrR family transcriptional regulator [Pseudomonadota bacterium]